MPGRNPTLRNVVPMHGGRAAPVISEKQRLRAVARDIARRVKRLMPKGLDARHQEEWTKIATLLAEPTLDRLKPHFCLAIMELCRSNVKLERYREAMPSLKEELYRVKGRNGDQVKVHPFVGQINETQRVQAMWIGRFGLDPASERRLALESNQGDLFADEAEAYEKYIR